MKEWASPWIDDPEGFFCTEGWRRLRREWDIRASTALRLVYTAKDPGEPRMEMTLLACECGCGRALDIRYKGSRRSMPDYCEGDLDMHLGLNPGDTMYCWIELQP